MACHQGTPTHRGIPPAAIRVNAELGVSNCSVMTNLALCRNTGICLVEGGGRGRVPAHPRSKIVGELLDVAARRLARAGSRVKGVLTPIRRVAGQVDDLGLRPAGHGRACDRSGEPVPCFDELVLGPLVVLEGQGQSVRSHARSMPPRRLA
jgi:hypothetical protein